MNNIDDFKSFLDKNYNFYQENYQKTNILDPYTRINTKNLKLITFLKKKFGDDVFPNNYFHCNICNKSTKYEYFVDLLECKSHVCRNYKRQQHFDKLKKIKDKHNSRDKTKDYTSKLTGVFYNFGSQADIMSFSKELLSFDITLNDYIIKYHPESIKYCKVCSTMLLPQRKNLISALTNTRKFCSHKCYYIDKKQNKELYIAPKESRERQSKILKNKIKNGLFTPARNVYTHWKSYNSLTNTKYRSRWEYIFHIRNPSFIYEKVRIKYYDTTMNKERIYIIDFQDPITNDLYEVKPNSERYSQNVIDKEKALNDYCNNHSINFNYINEDYIIDCYTYFEENNIKIDKDLVECIMKLKKQKLKE